MQMQRSSRLNSAMGGESIEGARLSAAPHIVFKNFGTAGRGCGKSLVSYQGMPSGIPQVAENASGFSR
jgi:hypothetical protein